jgi:hypothetical protein
MIDGSMNKRPLDEMTMDDDNKSDAVEPMVRLHLHGDWDVSCLETWCLKCFLLVTGCRTWDFSND